MKKILGFIGLVAIAFSSHASYLYWQVDLTGLDQEGNVYKFNGHEVTGFQVTAKKEGSADTTLTSYYNSASGPVAIQNPGTSDTGMSFYAGSESWDSTGWTYYIEIVGHDSAVYSNPDTGVIGYSQLANPSIVASLSSMEQVQSAMSAWQGAGVYSVPEPTGAMLMIFGLAMLGLKRRKV